MSDFEEEIPFSDHPIYTHVWRIWSTKIEEYIRMKIENFDNKNVGI